MKPQYDETEEWIKSRLLMYLKDVDQILGSIQWATLIDYRDALNQFKESEKSKLPKAWKDAGTLARLDLVGNTVAKMVRENLLITKRSKGISRYQLPQPGKAILKRADKKQPRTLGLPYYGPKGDSNDTTNGSSGGD